MAHEEGNLNDIRAILGNEKAIKAYREEEAAVPGRHHHCPNSLELRPRRRKTTKSLAVPNLSWPGPPRTGFSLWSRTQENTPRRAAGGSLKFEDGKPADEAVHKTCFACHEAAKARDFVFARHALMDK